MSVLLNSWQQAWMRSTSKSTGRYKVIGPNGKAYVILLRGIFKNFKIPIWYGMRSSPNWRISLTMSFASPWKMVVAVFLVSSLGVYPNDSYFKHPAIEGENFLSTLKVVSSLAGNNLKNSWKSRQ